MLRFLVLFLVLLTTLFALEMLAPVQRTVILPWTALLAELSGWLMQWFDADIIVNGKVIRSAVSNFGVSIEPGCNGVEAMDQCLPDIELCPFEQGRIPQP